MSPGCGVATIRNLPSKFWLRFGLVGGSVLGAPLASGSVHVDGLAAAYIMVACTSLPFCWHSNED